MSSITPKDRQVFFILLSAGLLYVLPIILADFYYIDDLGRSLKGYQEWGALAGRPLADFLMWALSFSSPLLDISPLPLILSIVCFSLTGVLLIRKYCSGSPMLGSAACLLLLANPFFLENLSYKFDSLIMILAICFSVLPFVVSFRSEVVRLIVNMILLLAVMSLYQPALNIYLILLVIEILWQVKQGVSPRDILWLIVRHIALLAVSCLLYLVVIFPIFVSSSFGEHFGRSLELGQGLERAWGQLLMNGRNFFVLLSEFFTHTARIIFLPCLALATLGIWGLGFQYLRIFKSKIGGWVVVMLVLLAPVFLVLLTVGMLLALEAPYPVPRVLMGFGGLLFSIGIIFSWYAERRFLKSNYLLGSCLVVMLTYLFVFSFVYGNALKVQKNFDTFLISMIATDFSSLKLPHSKRLALDGGTDRAPGTQLAIQKYPLLGRLVPNYFTENWMWGVIKLNHYGMNFANSYTWHKFRRKYPESVDINCRQGALLKNGFYRIYQTTREDWVVLSFRKCPGVR